MNSRLVCIIFAGLAIASCKQKKQVLLPAIMPGDCLIILSEKNKEGTSVAYKIDTAAITIMHPTGNAWHGGTSKQKILIPKAKIEALYQLILQNRFDKIENITGGENKPVDKDISISVYFNNQSVVVYNGLLQLSKKDEVVFNKVYQAIITIAVNAGQISLL